MQAVIVKGRKTAILSLRYLSLLFGLVPLAVWLFLPTYGVSFQISGAKVNGGIQTYQTSKMEGYYSTWAGVGSTSEEISFNGYVPTVQKLYFHVDAVDEMDFDGMTVTFFGVPVQELDAQTLYESVYEKGYCDIFMQDGRMHWLRTDYDEDVNPYFRVGLPYGVPWYALALYGVVVVAIAAMLAVPVLLQLSRIPYGNTLQFMLEMPFLLLFLGEWINENIFLLQPQAVAMNYGVLLSAFLFLYILLPYLWMTVLCNGTLFTVWYIGNYFVQEFRGKPLLPQDFLAINTAAAVVSGYDFRPKVSMLLAVCVLAAGVPTAKAVERKESPPHFRHKLILGILIPVIGVCAYPAYSEIKINYWDSDMVYTCQQNGTVVFFIKFAQVSVIHEPEGYSEQALQKILAKYSEPQTVEGIQPTNILVVMNESFADMRVSGTDYDVDILPYWDQLTQNHTSGTLYVSVQGGGTCNTEFESITGNSLAFLPAGSTPFANLINQDVFSLGSYFSQQGYQVASLHLQNPQNWNRKKVYPYLGLEPFYSFANYDTETMDFLRGSYVSDEEDYRYLIELEESMRGSARFLFNVTLQNHGGYSKNEELPNRVDLSAYGKYPTAETYLTLMKLSDQALRELIAYYQEIQEPTMIVIYGDHQPSLGEGVDNWLFGEEAEQLQKYAVPFCIWTNYAADNLTIDAMSANYLPGLILRLGNFPLPPYLQLVEEVFQEYPVLTQQGIVSKEGTLYNNISELSDDELLKEYSYVQYNSLFDNKCPELYRVVN